VFEFILRVVGALWCSPPGEFALYFDVDRRTKNSAKIQHQQLELNGQKNFMGGRMYIDLGSLFVACDLNLNWWSY
jgi:hypothetical protein